MEWHLGVAQYSTGSLGINIDENNAKDMQRHQVTTANIFDGRLFSEMRYLMKEAGVFWQHCNCQFLRPMILILP